jgi:hypothetical protein
MKVLSISEFAKQQGIVGVNPIVKLNVNGYPFITFLTGERDSEGKAIVQNVWFSKEASSRVAEGVDISAELKNMSVVETTNEAGELRLKLAYVKYVDLNALLGA